MLIDCGQPCVVCPPTPVGGEGLGISPNPNDPNNPFVNLSSEKPDRNLFIRIYTGGGNGDDSVPPIGSPWTAAGCVSTCFSDVSQAEADLCALNQNQICSPFGPNPNGPGPDNLPQGPGFPDEPPILPAGPQAIAVPNVAQSCPEKCEGGITNGFLVPAGAVSGGTQKSANDYAHYIACLKTLCGNDAQFCSTPCADGSVFTFTVEAGKFYASNRDAANAIAYSYACNQANLNKVCIGSLSVTKVCLGSSFSSTVSVSTALLPVSITLESGGLPAGVSIELVGDTQVRVFGTPTVSFAFTLRATNSAGYYTDKDFTIEITEITSPDTLPAGTVGTPYSTTLTGAGLDTTPFWAVTSGALPPGLSLNTNTGEISGTPTGLSASYGFTITMNDALLFCSKIFTMTVNAVTCFADDLVWIDSGLDPVGNPLGFPTDPAALYFLNNTWDMIAQDNSIQGYSVYGSASYTGPAVNMELDMIAFGATCNLSIGDFSVVIYDADTFAIYLGQSFTCTTAAPGVIPFSIPLSAARNLKVWVWSSGIPFSMVSSAAINCVP